MIDIAVGFCMLSLIDSIDRVPPLKGSGVPFRSEYHIHAVAGFHRPSNSVEPPDRTCLKSIIPVTLHKRENGLGFRIAEPAVEFHYLRALPGLQ